MYSGWSNVDKMKRSFISLKRERDTVPPEELVVVVPDKQANTVNALCQSIKKIKLDDGKQEFPGTAYTYRRIDTTSNSNVRTYLKTKTLKTQSCETTMPSDLSRSTDVNISRYNKLVCDYFQTGERSHMDKCIEMITTEDININQICYLYQGLKCTLLDAAVVINDYQSALDLMNLGADSRITSSDGSRACERMWNLVASSDRPLPETAFQVFMAMNKQNSNPMDTPDEEQNRIYDVYVRTDVSEVNNIYDESKNFMTVNDLFFNHEYDTFGDDFVNEEEEESEEESESNKEWDYGDEESYSDEESDSEYEPMNNPYDHSYWGDEDDYTDDYITSGDEYYADDY